MPATAPSEPASTTPPLADPVDEARRVAAAAARAGVTLNLIGGAAVRVCCPSTESIESIRRTPKDLDYVAHLRESRGVRALFGVLGYEPNKVMNAIQGRKRLQFFDRANGRQVDIFLDLFEMCHVFDLKNRLDAESATLPVGDLYLTKLQIVELNRKDVVDLFALLHDHPVDEPDGSGTVGSYIADRCSREWGLYQTVLDSLSKLDKLLKDFPMEPPQWERIATNLSRLQREIEEAPKTVGWKLRAAVGKRVRWYELPEEQRR
jgi:hypothetical protein